MNVELAHILAAELDAERALADDLANVLSRYAHSPPRAKYADVAAVLARYREARPQ